MNDINKKVPNGYYSVNVIFSAILGLGLSISMMISPGPITTLGQISISLLQFSIIALPTWIIFSSIYFLIKKYEKSHLVLLIYLILFVILGEFFRAFGSNSNFVSVFSFIFVFIFSLYKLFKK